MSSEGENAKDLSTEVNKTSVDNIDDNSSEDSQDKEVTAENDEEKSNAKKDVDLKVTSDKPLEAVENKENDDKKEIKPENSDESKNKDVKEKDESKTDNDTEEGEDSNKEDEDSKKEEKKGVPLLDQPLEQSGTRERKKVQRFNEDFTPAEIKEGKAEIPSGAGVQLGEIPRIDASISRFKNDDLKLLHRLLYKAPGKTALIKKNIKKFNGFNFKKDSEEYSSIIDSAKKFELKQLKSICEMLDLEKKGVKEEIVQRVVDFLIEPKDSGKPVGGGRPKRTAAVRANNRGYSSHDDSYSSDERRAARGGRGKGKRTNLKDDSTSESDEEFHPSDASESRPRVVKRMKAGRKKTKDSAEEEEDEDDDDGSEVDSPTSDDSDDEPKKRKKSKKVTNNKSKGKSAPRGRGRKPAADSDKKTTAPKKGGRKRDRDSSEESEPHGDEDNATSSEDEPLIKKAKSPQPPTDEEIKKYVKEILDGANLEEITMKTVCKQVYAHYPDFDLAHKKDFIKSTVKSLIST